VPRSIRKEKMVLISLWMPKTLLNELDELVKQGRFTSRAEAIRLAIIELLRKERMRGTDVGRPMIA